MKLPNDSSPQTAPNATAHVCSQCGAHEAVEFAGTFICVECYTAASSCCPEFDLNELVTRHPRTKMAR